MEKLEYLKRKPEYIRRRITLVTTSVVFLIIATMWWNSLNVNSATPEQDQSLSIREVISPLGALTKSFKEFSNEAAVSMGSIRQVLDNASTSNEVAGGDGVVLSDNNTGQPVPSTNDVVYPKDITDPAKSDPPNGADTAKIVDTSSTQPQP